jgi:hypothetical protein
MSNTQQRRDWNVLDDKRAAIIAVLEYIISQPPTIGQRCVQSDGYVMRLFEDPAIGNIDLPPGIKTVFMPAGTLDQKAKGSVVIELPPSNVNATGNDLLKYVLCCYNVWATAK